MSKICIILVFILLSFSACYATQFFVGSKTVLMEHIKCEDIDPDDTLKLIISEPNITKSADKVVYTWKIECCDTHNACDEAWLMTDNKMKGDVNNDKLVNFEDMAVLANNWLKKVN